jgi:hypothetical protein
MNSIRLFVYKNFNKIIYVLGFVSFPALINAQNADNKLFGLVNSLTGLLLGGVLTIIGMLMLVYFLLGVFKYVRNAGDAGAKGEAIKMITHGLIGLFVFISVWAIVNIFVNSFVGSSGVSLTPKK